MNGHIYLVENSLNGKLYVGQTTDEKNKRGHGTVLLGAYKKYGKERFSYNRICSGIDNKNKLDTLEKFWIKTMNSLCPYGYNIELGGNVNSLSEESKAKISRSLMGHIPWNKGIHTGLIPWNKGKPITEELRAKISSALKGNVAWNYGTIGVMKAWNKGLSTPIETRKKQSAAKIGKPGVRLGSKHTTDSIEKMRTAHLGFKHSQESILKMSVAKTGKKQLIAICNHCGKTGGSGTLKRWHFNNCKFKES